MNDRDGQLEVAVLLHVEVDELRGRRRRAAAAYSGRSRATTAATVASKASDVDLAADREIFTET